jgi:hypothetical protein
MFNKNIKCKFCKKIIHKNLVVEIEIKLHKVCFLTIKQRIDSDEKIISYISQYDTFNISLIEFIKRDYKKLNSYLN